MFYCKVNDKDISEYVTDYSWSGDIEQAGRKIEFNIAYNLKDNVFINIDINIGDKVCLYYLDRQNNQFEIFSGIIFFRERISNSYTMHFLAYDKLIYLAKSKMTKKFKNITVESVIRQVCNELNVSINSICNVNIYVDFIADNMTGTEIIKKALAYATAKTNKKYHLYINENKLNVIENNFVIDDFILNDKVNVVSTSHSESIEDMINKIEIINENGDNIGYVTNDNDINSFGIIQDIYKVDKKQDTHTQAKAMLKSISYNSSIEAIGNIQCISGYSVTIQEEQLKGKFLIKSDSHTIQNNIHKMNLTVEFLEVG